VRLYCEVALAALIISEIWAVETSETWHISNTLGCFIRATQKAQSCL
jgi:hypothetical protein